MLLLTCFFLLPYVFFQIQKLSSCIVDASKRESSGTSLHTEFYRAKIKDPHTPICYRAEKGEQPVPWLEPRAMALLCAEPPEGATVPDSGKGAKSLVELLVSNGHLL